MNNNEIDYNIKTVDMILKDLNKKIDNLFKNYNMGSINQLDLKPGLININKEIVNINQIKVLLNCKKVNF